MNGEKINSTAKVYFDTDGNEVTLRQLIKMEPEWAHSRIQAGERAEAELDQLRAELEKERERANTAESRLNAVVNSISDLINDSQGVAGLHLNGDIAPWESLLRGGFSSNGLAVIQILLAPYPLAKGVGSSGV